MYAAGRAVENGGGARSDVLIGNEVFKTVFWRWYGHVLMPLATMEYPKS
jgi:hypothetical protein